MGHYGSTRSNNVDKSSIEAILQGLSTDGGLFVPKKIERIDFKLEEMLSFDYQTLAYRVMRLFLDDLQEGELKYCIQSAYNEKFDSIQIAPLVSTKKAYFLELFHGPTLAFKDMALSILPHLMSVSKRYKKEEKEIVILTATSGDTGKAALEGFKDVEGTKIIVFFPEEGVSEIQKRQMMVQKGDNTLVVGIRGNFDDAQTGVKQIFQDNEFKEELEAIGYKLSSANSINIGRLIPQVVYYFYAYLQLVKDNKLQIGEAMNVVVPTGNFGNILAAYYASLMGLPINKFICASNKNNVLTDFFEQGIYDKRRNFYTTNSPSMDILISSNLERFLYHMSGEDTVLVAKLMEELKEKGHYEVDDRIKKKMRDFIGGFIDDQATKDIIKKVYNEEKYLIDTHTAVAYGVYENYVKRTGDVTPTVIVSTASPYKFTESVMSALDESYTGKNDFSLLKEMENFQGRVMPRAVKELEDLPIRHKLSCEINDMKKCVHDFLK